ncbi:MAG TPA: hypothetical protein VFJ48_05220 [Casimicrobiaceae bacterium]|nr:hypothetical protein [Casimicrobiaceae bacterium]
MTILLTFHDVEESNRRIPRWAIALAAMAIAMAAPAMACEKIRSTWAATQSGPRTIATFTGEFVNGAPVYRLPSITVVTRRELEVARTLRDAAQPNAARSPASSAPAAPSLKRKVASASHEAIAVKPCVGYSPPFSTRA